VYDNEAFSAVDIIFKRTLYCIVTWIVESMQHNSGETIEPTARSCGFEVRLNSKVNLWTEQCFHCRLGLIEGVRGHIGVAGE
jgi:hypothetical protein